MNKILQVLFYAFFALQGFSPLASEPDSKETNVFFANESFLTIKGKTNVSKFECHFNMNVLSDSIQVLYRDFDDFIKFSKANLILPNLQFDCGGKAINKDFNKLLNTDEFPEITIKLNKISIDHKQDAALSASVDIIISDIVNTYVIPIQLNSNSKDPMVNGVLPLNINDFNLTAPTKVLGMVKVSPEIEIAFCLKIVMC